MSHEFALKIQNHFLEEEMKQNMKKILSIVLVAAICLTAFPFSVFAEDAHDHAEEVMPVCDECLVNTNVTKTGRVNEEATCTEATGEWYVCSNAKGHKSGTAKEFIKADGKAKAHHVDPEFVTHVTKVDSNCQEDGVNEYWYCKACKTYYKTAAMTPDAVYKVDEDVNETVIPQDDDKHVFDKDVYSWKNGIVPDCGVSGAIKLSPCQVEGCDYVKEEAIAAEDHAWEYLSHVPGVDCTTATTVTEKCANCGETREVVGNAFGHELSKTEAVTGGCTVKAEDAYWTCATCGKYFADKDGVADTTKAIEKDSWVKTYVHTLTKHTKVDATCTDAGNIEYQSCSACEKNFLTEDDAKANKEYEGDVTIKALSHKLVEVKAQDATCIAAGHKAHFDCERCDKFFEDKDAKKELEWADIEIAKKAHTWKDQNDKTDGLQMWVDAVASTCTTAGNVKYSYCTACEKNYDEDGKELADVRPVPTVPNTNGTETFVEDADRYGYVQHNWVPGYLKVADCDTTGIITWACADCDAFSEVDTVVRYSVPAFRHKNATYVAYKANTCVAPGNKAYIACPDCDGYYLVAEEGATVTVKDNVTVTIDELSFFKNVEDATIAISATAHPHTKGEGDGADYKFTAEKKATDCDDIDGYIAYYTCLLCDANYVEDGEGFKNVADVGNAHTQEFVAAETPSCQKTTYAAHYECSCGLWYKANETVFKAKNAVEKDKFINSDHSYTFVDEPINKCGKEYLAAHYECTIEGCTMLFVKDGDKYVEKTAAELTKQPTGEHSWQTEASALYPSVVPAVPCTGVNAQGTPGIKECVNCGKLEGYTQHNYTIKTYINATTCVVLGTYNLECATCHTLELEGGVAKVYTDTEYNTHIEASAGLTIGHYPRVAATCTETGTIEYWTCGHCNGKFTNANLTDAVSDKDIVIPTHAEEAAADITAHAERFTATCGVKEKNQFFCDKCDKYSETEDFQGELSDKPFTYVSATHTDGTVEVALVEVADSFKDSTCLKTGHKQTYKCNGKCGKTFIKVVDGTTETYVEATETNVVIPVKAHNGTFVPYVAPTCTTNGVWAHYTACTVADGCGLTYFAKDIYAIKAENTSVDDVTKITVGEGDDAEEVVKTWSADQFPAALGHVQNTANTVAGKGAVCDGKGGEIAGNIAYYTCDVCKKIFANDDTASTATELLKDKTVEEGGIIIKNHDKTITEIPVAPTCTEVGYIANVCTCGFTTYDFVPANGHNITASNKGTAPICGTVGYEEFYYCADCKTSFKDADCTEVWATYEKEADPQAKAIADRTIKAIGFHYNVVDGEKVKIDTTSCDNGKWILKDGVWVEDKASLTCDGCGEFVGQEHTFTTVTVEANCSAPQSSYDVCTKCLNINENTRTYSGIENPNNHGKFEVRITEGTTKCTDANRFYNWCPLCEQKIGDAFAGTHSYTEYERDDAYCGVKGTSYQKCDECGDLTTVEIPAADGEEGKHDFTGAQWINVAGKENDYTTDKAEYRECQREGCAHVEYRAHQDVHFTATIDSAIVSGAAIVNTGKVAVTFKVSANNKTAQAFKFTFNYSDNLYFDKDATVWHDFANKFGTLSVNTDGNGTITVLVMNLLNDVKFGTETENFLQEEAVVTLYFDVASNAFGEDVEITNIALAQMVATTGTVAVTGDGADVTAPIAMLGDGNTVNVYDDDELVDTYIGDGVIDLVDLQALVPLFMHNPDALYLAQLDFDKNGLNDVNDFEALVAYSTDGDYYALIH